jgi:DNA-binding transcriptional MerR regulator
MQTKNNEALYEARYTIVEAARFVGLTSSRVRRWLRGYHYRWTADGIVKACRQEPIVMHRDETEESIVGVSFLDLIELFSVKSFIEKGFTLQRIRAAVAEAEALLEQDHPFARRSFFVDSQEIYLQAVEKRPEGLLQLFSDGQLAIADVVRHKAQQITFDATSGLPLDWWPLGREKEIVLCPSIAYGAPALASRSIKTVNVHDMFLAEHGAIEPVCSWFGISSTQVHSAVEFEQQLKTA